MRLMLVDADELERMGYVLTRTYKQDKETMVHETKKLSDVPSVELNRKGRWIKEPWHSDHVRQCSACHVTQTVTTYRGIVNFKFCPYCGADMRGKSDE